MLEVILALILIVLVILYREIQLLMELNNEVAKNQLITHEKLQAIIDSIIRAAEANNGKLE